MGWKNFAYSGPILPIQVFYIQGQKKPVNLCDPIFLATKLQIIEIFWHCKGLSLDQATLNMMLDFFVLGPTKVSKEAYSLGVENLNCYFTQVLGADVSKCILPQGQPANMDNIQSALSTIDYLKKNPNVKYTSAELCNFLSTGNNPNDPQCFTITHKTDELPNKERNIVGIGEEVIIDVKDLCTNPVTNAVIKWTILNMGTEAVYSSLCVPTPLSPKVMVTNGIIFSMRIESGFKPGKYKIIAKMLTDGQGCPANCRTEEFEYEVIEPEDILYIQNPLKTCGGKPAHVKNKPSTGFYADMYLLPKTVNFHKVKIQEKKCPTLTKGKYFDLWTDYKKEHDEGYMKSMTGKHDPNLGTEVNGTDQINMFFECDDIISAEHDGTFTWNIPIVYFRPTANQTEEEITLPFSIPQIAENKGKKFTVSKGNGINKMERSTMLLDDTNIICNGNSVICK